MAHSTIVLSHWSVENELGLPIIHSEAIHEITVNLIITLMSSLNYSIRNVTPKPKKQKKENISHIKKTICNLITFDNKAKHFNHHSRLIAYPKNSKMFPK